MASDTATANPDREERSGDPVWLPGSRLGRLIVGANLLGLLILIVGALVLNELGRGLINARIDSLTSQAEFIANVIDKAATEGDPEPILEADRARDTLQLLFIPHGQRAHLFDAQGALIADSDVLADRIDIHPLPPVRKPGGVFKLTPPPDDTPRPGQGDRARLELEQEARHALLGKPVSGVRTAPNGDRVVSVSIPIRHVKAVLGVLTLEGGDLDKTIAAQRRALIPFILIAMAVSLSSSLLLNSLVARPVRRLARAADRVRMSRARAISLPDLAGRNDELGDLTRSLESMTSTLSERMDAIERFAADVAHEIRNPLTSIRSAVETMDLVKDKASFDRLTGILKQDVSRLDRLVTDISNASRLDAELSRENPRPIDLSRLLADITGLYEGTPPVTLDAPEGVRVLGQEGPLGQVFRNLIDNARSFTHLGEVREPSVRLAVAHDGKVVTATVDDDGPGIPPEAIERVFQRFYTSRPRGAAFGGNSGLGLAIARQIVEAHNGTLKAENRLSEDGRVAGARFTVILPEAPR